MEFDFSAKLENYGNLDRFTSQKSFDFNYLTSFGKIKIFEIKKETYAKKYNLNINEYKKSYIIDEFKNIYYAGNYVDENYSEYEFLNELELQLKRSTCDFFAFIIDDFFYIDADEEHSTYNLASWRDPSKSVMFSFKCITELDPEGIQKLKNKDMILIDFTETGRLIQVTKEEVLLLATNQILVPPEKGYTLINNSYWHRSESVLFYDKTTDKSYLLGQDDDQYFGVELPVNPQTMEEAFECLKPEEVKGKKFERQGEWFIVSMNRVNVPGDLPVFEDLPKEHECILVSNDNSSISFNLERELDGNPHKVTCKELLVSKKGEIFAYDAYVEHSDHDHVSVGGWVKFVKNTAVRSVSIEGVD